MVKKVYKLQDLPKLSSKKMSKMKTKMIEKRKVIIEDFLQRVLNEEVV